MSAHPITIPTGPEGSVWDAISDLRREVRQVREGRALAIQKFYYVYDAGVLSPSPTLLTPAFTPNISDADGWNCYFHLYWRQAAISDATSTWEFGVRDTDPSSVVTDTPVGIVTNFSGQVAIETIQPGAAVPNVALQQQDVLFKLNGPRSTLAPGDHIIRPYAKRTAGTVSTILWSYCYFYALVL